MIGKKNLKELNPEGMIPMVEFKKSNSENPVLKRNICLNFMIKKSGRPFGTFIHHRTSISTIRIVPNGTEIKSSAWM